MSELDLKLTTDQERAARLRLDLPLMPDQERPATLLQILLYLLHVLKEQQYSRKDYSGFCRLCQQVEINFSASAELHLTQSELYEAVAMMLIAAMINI
jgi:hypothetical protein